MLERLCRPATSTMHLREVDGLRLVALTTVVVAHVSGYIAARSQALSGIPAEGELLWHLASDGSRGVLLFFVISGFVLALPYLRAPRAPGELGRYFGRRLIRLEPPYLISLGVILIGQVLVHGDSLASLMPHAAAGVPYLHTVIFGVRNPVNSIVWSLEVEAQFYVLMPLLGVALRGARRRRILVSLLAVSLIAQLMPIAAEPRWDLSILGSAPFFILGVLLATLHAERPIEASRHGAWDVAALAGLVLFVAIGDAVSVWRDPAMVLACGVLTWAALRSFRWRGFLRRPPVWIVGGMCYSIYLLHFQIIRLVWRPARGLVGTDPASSLVILLAVMIPVVLAAGAVFFVLVERPWMVRASRLRVRATRGPELLDDQAYTPPQRPEPIVTAGPRPASTLNPGLTSKQGA